MWKQRDDDKVRDTLYPTKEKGKRTGTLGQTPGGGGGYQMKKAGGTKRKRNSNPLEGFQPEGRTLA